jgi:hypothetical protein
MTAPARCTSQTVFVGSRECPTPPYERNTQQSPFRGRVIAHESLDAAHTDAELSGAGPKERRPAVIVGYCRHILGRAGQAAHL